MRNVYESPPGWVDGFVRCQRGHQKDQESDPMPIFDNLKSFLASPFVYLNDEIEEEE